MNLLALVGTVWLVTTPSLIANGRFDRIGFIGSTVQQGDGSDGTLAYMQGLDRTVGFDFPIDVYEETTPIVTGSTNVLLVVHADPAYCEAFVVNQLGKKRMRGIAVFFKPDCQTVLKYRQYRWYAKRLY